MAASALGSTGEFTIDQQLSLSHVAVLAAVAMTIGTVFSPLAGAFIIAVVCLFLLVVRRSPVNAMALAAWRPPVGCPANS